MKIIILLFKLALQVYSLLSFQFSQIFYNRFALLRPGNWRLCQSQRPVEFLTHSRWLAGLNQKLTLKDCLKAPSKWCLPHFSQHSLDLIDSYGHVLGSFSSHHTCIGQSTAHPVESTHSTFSCSQTCGSCTL